jgi:hypothetical protein
MITMNLVHFERSVDALVRSGILCVARFRNDVAMRADSRIRATRYVKSSVEIIGNSADLRVEIA